MNRPGAESGNWDWRAPDWALDTGHPTRERLAHLTWLGRRRPEQRLSLHEEAESEGGGGVDAAR